MTCKSTGGFFRGLDSEHELLQLRFGFARVELDQEDAGVVGLAQK
ncbi:hypothetical protein [Hymenobacter arizonensis]|nr:hypothetical protein [Hymenobacter arizonensis]